MKTKYRSLREVILITTVLFHNHSVISTITRGGGALRRGVVVSAKSTNSLNARRTTTSPSKRIGRTFLSSNSYDDYNNSNNGSNKNSNNIRGLAFIPSKVNGHRPSANTATTPVNQRRQQERFFTTTSVTPTKMTGQSIGEDKASDMQRVVLVGGGHAHVQVIKALNKASRPKNMHVTLIDVQNDASYSGMVPGCVSGLYRPEDTLLHLGPLAEWSGIEFINDRVIDIDLQQNLIHLQNDGTSSSSSSSKSSTIPFDVVSLDIGSASRGLNEIPGAKEYTIPTRPISDLVRRLEAETAALKKSTMTAQTADDDDDGKFVDVVVIGGGAAGLELSMSLAGRWDPILNGNGDDDNNNGRRLRMTLLDSGSEILPYESVANRNAMKQALADRNIVVRHHSTVQRVKEHSVILNDGQELPFQYCLWATGAGAHDLAFTLGERKVDGSDGLTISSRGWIQVNEYLQSVSHPQVFAAGDCCTMEGAYGISSTPPKAGVYAVRSGPILIQNLTKYLKQQRQKQANKEKVVELTPYQPQDDFLKLVICGDGTALGFRFGIPFQGKWVFQLKDKIDRGFMDLFKVENLPSLTSEEEENDNADDDDKSQEYDTSQYDAVDVERPPKKDPYDAAELLQRTDDDVNFQEAWDVLRDMSSDEEYRQSVLSKMSLVVRESVLVKKNKINEK